MSGIGNGYGQGSHAAEERGARAARLRALAVLRVRSWGTAVALLPAAVAVVLLAGGPTGHLTGPGWDAARWAVTAVAVLVLLVAGAVALVISRARPAVTPTVDLAPPAAPDLYRMVQDLADRLGVPAPSAIALTPDCDSWLEDRTHPAHGNGRTAGLRRSTDAPVLVIGSPFLWWMRVGELRAVLAPVVAGTGPSAQPDIAAARRFVQGLDAAVAAHRSPGLDPVRRLGARGVGAVARVLLRSCRGHAAEMERGVAVAASERAQAVDYGVRIVAQEQVGLAYAGWDRLLTRVALPAWRMGRWPSRLDAGVVSALTELSRRDRLAEGFTSRLGERPACDLLEEPGVVDEAASLLAARLFHGGPAEPGPDWAPVHWQQYPEEVVDRKWRTDAARLHGVLDRLGVLPAGASGADPNDDRTGTDDVADGPTLARVLSHLSTAGAAGTAGTSGTAGAAGSADPVPAAPLPAEPPADALAAALTAEVAREEARRPAPAPVSLPGAPGHAHAVSGSDALPLFPLQPPRTGRDLLADHVTAMVCCAAVDTAGARPGLDWLDGPALFLGEERQTELTSCVLTLVEDGDPDPLRVWLARTGVRPEKPVRLV